METGDVTLVDAGAGAEVVEDVDGAVLEHAAKNNELISKQTIRPNSNFLCIVPPLLFLGNRFLPTLLYDTIKLTTCKYTFPVTLVNDYRNIDYPLFISPNLLQSRTSIIPAILQRMSFHTP